MSNVIQMLEQMAISTGPQTQRNEIISTLAANHQLSAELQEAIQQADLSGLIIMAGANGGGAPFIVAPDEGEAPAEDEEDDQKKISH